MSRDRLDMRLKDEEREKLELIKAVHKTSMTKFVRYCLMRGFEEIGLVKKVDVDELLKKKYHE